MQVSLEGQVELQQSLSRVTATRHMTSTPFPSTSNESDLPRSVINSDLNGQGIDDGKLRISSGMVEGGDEASRIAFMSYDEHGEHIKPSNELKEEKGRVTAFTVQHGAFGEESIRAGSCEASKVDEESLRSRVQAISVSDENGSALRSTEENSIAKEELKTYNVASPSTFEDRKYVDPTPRTPRPSAPPSRAPSSSAPTSREASRPGDREQLDNGCPISQPGITLEERETDDSKSEIKSIMDQFNGEGSVDDSNSINVMSPQLEFAGSLLGGALQHPPRKSSLEPSKPESHSIHPTTNLEAKPAPSSYMDDMSQLQEMSNPQSETGNPPDGEKISSGATMHGDVESKVQLPQSPVLLSKPPPPEPDPEPDLPFQFNRFLEQLRHKTADPVAKFLRSFLAEFGKKQWMVHEQVKIISDFLAFIANKMAQCDIWRGISDTEFDNAKEGMEKLVMNRLYSQTFSPAIPPPPVPTYAKKGKLKNIEKLVGPGRKGQHQEDIERDEILAQKIRIYGWVEEQHLDISPVGPGGRKFLVLAQQELLKIRTYRAPRDKVVCVLNCCKVIFGLLRNSKSSDTSADSFVPLLIYVVLHANPDHLVSNVQYILRFRNQDKLGGEAGYYLSSLMGAIQFIENLDRTNLTVSDDEFERKVEAAVSAITEREKDEGSDPIDYPHMSEKSSLSEPEVTIRNSRQAEHVAPSRSTSIRGSADLLPGGDAEDQKAPVPPLLRTIQKPLSSIGRIFSEDSASPQFLSSPRSQPPFTPQPGVSRLSPTMFMPPRNSTEDQRVAGNDRELENPKRNQSGEHSAADAAARQASAETAEIQRIQRAEHYDVVETLTGMFPNLERDLISDVVRQKEGRVGAAVDACLALSS